MEKLTYYEEAMRYVEYAKSQFACSPIKDNYYSDKKYVKAGGGTIYAGIEKSAKWYITLNGGKIAKNASEPEITKELSRINKKALSMFNDLYSYFHIAVYYNDNSSVKKIKESIGIANKFIALLKPFDLPHQYKRGGNIWKELSGKPISNKSLKNVIQKNQEKNKKNLERI